MLLQLKLKTSSPRIQGVKLGFCLLATLLVQLITQAKNYETFRINTYVSIMFRVISFHIIIVVIIMCTSEKHSQNNNSDITVIWVSDWFKWANLFKISSSMSQFSTNKRTLSVICCFLFAVFNICDPQHQVSNSITTQSNNRNSKPSSQSQVDPSGIKQFRCECL